MNGVIAYIEENLTQPIQYESLSQIVGCSVYEFSRIFSLMAGMSVSEYIRRRRLSQAVFDIQNSNDKIIDIALKYCYESPTTFTRAFKELHGTTPLSARKTSVSFKTYPPITFVLTIKGVNVMEFRIEKKESFQIMGLSGYETKETERVGDITGTWAPFMADYDKKLHDYYSAPYWQVGASSKKYVDGKMKLTIGAEYKGKMIEGMDIETIPAATYAVFSFEYPVGYSIYEENYAKILTEWFPSSGYIRDENGMELEVYSEHWEIWIPVLSK